MLQIDPRPKYFLFFRDSLLVFDRHYSKATWTAPQYHCSARHTGKEQIFVALLMSAVVAKMKLS